MKQSYEIILVDDEAETLQFVTSILQEQGYRLNSFLNALDALSFLEFTSRPIHLIIADLNMPYMNGLEFLKKVKKLQKYHTTPFLFISVVSDKKIQVQAFKEGAIDFISKPFDAQLFLAKIESLLDHLTFSVIKNNILLEGTHKSHNPDELINYCEQEKLSGFALISSGSDKGIISFENGVLLDISCKQLSGVPAYEFIKDWKFFSFYIIRGRYNTKSLERYLS